MTEIEEQLQALPAPFLERMKTIIPLEQKDRVYRSFIEEPVTSFRINTLKVSIEDAEDFLIRSDIPFHKVDWIENAYWVSPDKREQLMDTKLYNEKGIYIQNLSSMIPPYLLAPTVNEKVLDLAAAPGSKTLQLSALMENKGNVTAVEKVRKRYYKLLDNIKQNGAQNITVFNTNGEIIWKQSGGQFDKILLDAPCSTEARFRVDDEETYRYWSMRKIKEMVRKQSRLLYSAVQSLRVGGTLIYSTCSFAPEENEGVINRILQKFGDSLSIEPIEDRFPYRQPGFTTWKKKNYDSSIANCMRILPDKFQEGFFVCKMRKTNVTR